ncbi:MAG: AzlD domain-containing protein [Pseudomonadota bacterium]
MTPLVSFLQAGVGGAADAGLPDGLLGYVLIIGIAIGAHEVWRWAGLLLGRDLDPASEIFVWVQHVANALVAALVVRLIAFPAGLLANIALEARLGATAIGLAVFCILGNKLGLGVAAAALALGVLSQITQ